MKQKTNITPLQKIETSIEKDEEKTESQKVEPSKVEPEKEEQSLKAEPKPAAKPEPKPAAEPDDVPEFFRKKDEETKKKPKSKSKD